MQQIAAAYDVIYLGSHRRYILRAPPSLILLQLPGPVKEHGTIAPAKDDGPAQKGHQNFSL